MKSYAIASMCMTTVRAQHPHFVGAVSAPESGAT